MSSWARVSMPSATTLEADGLREADDQAHERGVVV
jgi:hypothetical protein